MANSVQEIIDSMDRIFAEVTRNSKPYQWPKVRMIEFINELNPSFPSDTFDILDLVFMVHRNGHIPSKESINILKDIIRDAEFYRGDIRWKYRHPCLTAHFSPRDGGAYNIHFKGKDGPTVFPITVTLEAYTDMDDIENHGEGCDMNGCDCEATVERTEERIFNNREEWVNLTSWLRRAHWGITER